VDNSVDDVDKVDSCTEDLTYNSYTFNLRILLPVRVEMYNNYHIQRINIHTLCVDKLCGNFP